MILRKQLKSFDLDSNLTMHKHWTCDYVFRTQSILFMEGLSYRDKEPFLYISFSTSSNRVRTHVLVAPWGTKMLTKTRDVLSLAPT